MKISWQKNIEHYKLNQSNYIMEKQRILLLRTQQQNNLEFIIILFEQYKQQKMQNKSKAHLEEEKSRLKSARNEKVSQKCEESLNKVSESKNFFSSEFDKKEEKTLPMSELVINIVSLNAEGADCGNEKTDANIAQIQKKNGEKTKVKKKSFQFESVFSEYFHFLRQMERQGAYFNEDRFKEFLFKRNSSLSKNIGLKLDLALHSLGEIIGFAKQKGLISNYLFNAFELEDSYEIEKIFIDRVLTENIQHINFSKYSFTPFDHRMISFILTKKYPKQFTNSHRPASFDRKTTVFYEFLYTISEKKYWQIFEAFNFRFSRKWMPNHEKIRQYISNSVQNESRNQNNDKNYIFHRTQRFMRRKEDK